MPPTLRTERRWSQAELATAIGSDPRQVSRYENGRITPNLDAITRIAQPWARDRACTAELMARTEYGRLGIGC